MAKFLNTTGINYHLELLINSAKDRLTLISPFLSLSDRIKELLADKNRLKIDVRIIFGKNDLQPEEVNWIKELSYIRTSFCKNLHAKCYMNDEQCIIGSLNLYEFSQVNNNEMGILITRTEDPVLYKDAYDEVQRIIRISDEVRMSLEKVVKKIEEPGEDTEFSDGKLSTAKLAKKLGMRTNDLFDKLIAAGYLEVRGKNNFVSDKGKDVGGEFRGTKFGPMFLWPAEMKI